MGLQTADLATIVFLAIIFIIGVPGNVLVLKVYFRKAKKSSTFVFISFMAISDLTLCVATLLHVGFLFTSVVDTKQILCSSMYYITVTFILLSVLTSLVVGLDRYVAVCWPHTKRMSVCTSLILSTICAVFSLSFAFPILFVVRVSSGEYDFISCKGRFDIYPFLKFAQVIGYTVGMSSVVVIIICYSLVWRTIRNHRLGKNRVHVCPPQTAGFSSVTAATFVTNNQIYSSSVALSHVGMQQIHLHQEHLNAVKIKSVGGQGSRCDAERKVKNNIQDESTDAEENTPKPISVISNSSGQFQQNADFQLNGTNSSMNIQKQNGNHKSGDAISAETSSRDLVVEAVKSSSRALPSIKRTRTSKVSLAVQRRITIMLFLIAVISLTSHPIMMFARALPDSTLNHIKQSSEIIFVLIRVAEFIGFINNAVNPFIYGLFDKSFRNECLKAFGCGTGSTLRDFGN
ncbi:Cholecystokinin receptor type A [Holothuria leucospilota]|uniref:Cholecystokinin receptor type A n=1 Tax=Holothuria leucospilota TaxID=206669 RepID=A0A9Q1CJW1_HOLLE|nr:Cholecystokinin receptor type A [Holothuria leucospilota]